MFDIISMNAELNSFDTNRYVQPFSFHTKPFQELKVGLDIFDSKGFYTMEFVSATYLNVLQKNYWHCYNARYDEENTEQKIRMSEIFSEHVVWQGDLLTKYMKKPHLEKAFKLKLSKEDKIDFNLLKGFYLGGKYGGFSGIYDVAAVLKKYDKEMEKKWGEVYLEIKIPLLILS